MAFDALFEFSDAQSIAATAQSTNILDWQASDLEMGAGTPIYLNIKIETAPTAGTSLTIVLHAASTTDIDAATTKTLWSSGTLLRTTLTAGLWITRIALPYDCDSDRYMGLQYTASGTLTSGTINAWLDHGPQSSHDTQVAASNI